MRQEKITQTVKCIKEFIVYANNCIWQEEEYITLITYSGRGMHGDECYAIVAPGNDAYQDFVSDLEDYAEEKNIKLGKDVFRELRKPKKDNLGHDFVYYCPSLSKVNGIEP